MYNLLYDGTFAGFLTALNRKLHQPALELSVKPANGFEEDIYSQDFVVETQPELSHKMLALMKSIFSSEEIQFMKRIIKQRKPGCEDLLCKYIFDAFTLRMKKQADDDEIKNAA